MHDYIRRRNAATDNDTQAPRSFADHDGNRWQVYEKAPADYDRRSGASLIFASETAVRRVRDFPANWRTLSDEQLAELSWKS